jgi:hypothetical protein
MGTNHECHPIIRNPASFHPFFFSYVQPHCIHYNKSDKESIFHFLEQFSNKSLFTDVNLDLICDIEIALIQFLPKFLPLVTSIDSIEFDEKILSLLENEQIGGQEMLTSARVLFIKSVFRTYKIRISKQPVRDISSPQNHRPAYYYGPPINNTNRTKFQITLLLIIYSRVDWVNWYRRWLQTPREDNKPRVLIGSNDHMQGTTRFTSFVQNIKKVRL